MIFFPQTNNTITNQKHIQNFIKKYAQTDSWHNTDYETGNLGYGWIHYALIRTLRPKRILCIGSRYGFIPAICALACKDNQTGIVDFVDAGYDQNQNDKNHWGGVGLWKRIDKDDYFKPFGLAPYINLHTMTSEKYYKKYARRKYGYIHIDGDHSYQGVKKDYRLFWPRLTSGGFIGFHDIFTKDLGGLNYGVNKFWNEIQMKHARSSEYAGNCGLGMLQKT